MLFVLSAAILMPVGYEKLETKRETSATSYREKSCFA